MGAGCSNASGVVQQNDKSQKGGTLGVMFRRIDKEKKGFIDLNDLEQLMRDDKTHFQGGKDANHIMNKYGTDGKMQFENFTTWWNSTYTTYNDDAMARIVEDAQADEMSEQHMEPIVELPEVPTNSNVAISRS